MRRMKHLNVISVTVFVRFVRNCPPYFLSVLKIQGTERSKTDTKHDPPLPPRLHILRNQLGGFQMITLV